MTKTPQLEGQNLQYLPGPAPIYYLLLQNSDHHQSAMNSN